MTHRAIYRTCSDCGKDFVITAAFQDQIESNNHKLPKRCKACRELRKNPYAEAVCSTCKKPFIITQNEHKFYKERGLSNPKRCITCRESEKNGKRDSKEAE